MIFEKKRRRTAADRTQSVERAHPRRRGGVDALLILNRVRHDPVDLDLLTAALGVELIVQPMADNICLTLDPVANPHRPDGLNWTLCINARHTESRRRFSIAHAIGHLTLHSDWIGDGLCDDIDYSCPGDGPRPNPRIGRDAERAANQVAVGILMPQGAVVRRHREFADLDGLARHFKVSRKAMRIRLEYLNLPLPPTHAIVAATR